MNVLVVVAHPDDEAYGAGGTIALLARDHRVVVHIVSEGASAQYPEQWEEYASLKRTQALKAAGILGIGSVSFGNMPDMRLATIGVLEISKSIAALCKDYRPDLVLTHWHGDLNADHRAIAEAVAVACRPCTCHGFPPDVLAMEIPSTTELSLRDAFHPTVFFDVGNTLHAKIKAILCYSSETRKPPHPRSTRHVRALASIRGAACGARAAEGFEVMRMVNPYQVHLGR